MSEFKAKALQSGWLQFLLALLGALLCVGIAYGAVDARIAALERNQDTITRHLEGVRAQINALDGNQRAMLADLAWIKERLGDTK